VVLAAAIGLCLLASVGGLIGTDIEGSDPIDTVQGTAWNAGRRLLFDKLPGTASPKALHLFEENTTPSEVLSEDELKNGGFVLHLIGCLYVFLGLAIVCDEYFVPALMVICSKDFLDLDDDVAGATFMAAGGSAPELFTSLIGTFQESDVGFGTIVGSAVFNVLFVIGMCAIMSKETLHLTWWPLFRDCTYYIFGLLVLAVFFGGVSPLEIHFWEALILFAMYLGYVMVMKYHLQMYRWVMFKTKGADWEKLEEESINVSFTNPSTFRAGFLKLVTSNKPLTETAGIHAVTQLKGDVYTTFQTIDKDNSGTIDKTELRELLTAVSDVPPSEADVQDASDHIGTDSLGHIPFENFMTWYLKSEARLNAEMEEAWYRYDTDRSDSLDHMEFDAFMHSLLMGLKMAGKLDEPEDELRAKVLGELDKNNDGIIQKEEFASWYRTSMYWQAKKLSEEEEADESEPTDLSWPTGNVRAQLMYLVTLPLVIAMMATIPDCRRAGALCGVSYRKLCVVAFVMSIVWIGIFSNFMVEWAAIVGDSLSIPTQVMGLTFLAAGTSVPDLLSSVIVAKQGKGDMAISSSIGSNIFDILVGLPFPWLCYCIYHWSSDGPGVVYVKADSLVVSICVLLLMLVIVVLIIKFNSWKMTKGLGWSMFVLYFVFVVQDLIRSDLWCDGGCI